MNPDFKERWRTACAMLGTIFGLWLLGVFIILFFVQATPPPQLGNVPDMCANNNQEVEKAKALVQTGLDSAVVKHTELLMSVWIQNNVGESRRAAVGITNGVRAYFHAQRQIDAWVIPPCKP